MARNWFGYSSAERVVQRYSLAMRYATVVAAAAVALAGAALASSSPAYGATVSAPPTINSSGAYGNPARYTPYLHLQVTGDCVEQSARLAMDAIGYTAVVSPSSIDKEAYKLGITGPTFDGSSFDASNVALFAHYGFKATAPRSISRATLAADLAKGASVQVTVYAGDLWDNMPDPAVPGDNFWDSNTTATPDHAVVVEAINKTTHAVTIGDTGIDMSYTVPWSVFSKAWAAGNYQAIVITK